MPYNPGITYAPIQQPHVDGSRWGAALLQMSETARIEKEKRKEADALANAYYKFATPPEGSDGAKAAHPLGDAADWKMKSAEDRFASMVAHKQSVEDARKVEALNMENQSKYANIVRDAAAANAMTQQQARQTAGDQAFPGFAADLAYQPDNSVEAPLTREQVLARAFARNPGVQALPSASIGSDLLGEALRARDENSPARQFSNETERMRAEAYRRQVELMGAGSGESIDNPPAGDTPAGMVTYFDGRHWRQTRAGGMSGFPVGSTPAELNGVQYMKSPDGTLYPTKQPTAGTAIAGALKDRGGKAAAGKETIFKPGDQVKQNGVIYEFDGQTWKSVK